MRTFETGATRNDDQEKLNYAGALSPIALKAFVEYMHKHRFQPDGSIREAGNWKKGMTLQSYMESGARHFQDWWMEYEGYESREGLIDALCGLLFNVQGYLHETLKDEKTRVEKIRQHLEG
jgi:hypothetical protein